MDCEMCGRPGSSVRAEIEGVVLSVCQNCSRLGRKVDVKYDIPDRKKMHIDETSVRPDFAATIKEARKKSGITVSSLAEKIGEKAGVIERIEHGMRPTDTVARKLEKALEVKIFGYEEVDVENKPSETRQTLGEIAVIRKKK